MTPHRLQDTNTQSVKNLPFSFNLKGYFTSGKMNVFKMGNLCRRNVKLFLNLELSRLRKARNFFLANVDERQQLPECTCFAALGGHAYR